MTTGKTIALTRWTFVGKVMSLLLNMLSRLVITFLPRSKRLLISWLQSPSAVIVEHCMLFPYNCGFPGGLNNLPIQVPSLYWEDPLEEKIATHSSILTWNILRTEEPGGLQSMCLQSQCTEQVHTNNLQLPQNQKFN